MSRSQRFLLLIGTVALSAFETQAIDNRVFGVAYAASSLNGVPEVDTHSIDQGSPSSGSASAAAGTNPGSLGHARASMNVSSTSQLIFTGNGEVELGQQVPSTGYTEGNSEWGVDHTVKLVFPDLVPVAGKSYFLECAFRIDAPIVTLQSDRNGCESHLGIAIAMPNGDGLNPPANAVKSLQTSYDTNSASWIVVQTKNTLPDNGLLKFRLEVVGRGLPNGSIEMSTAFLVQTRGRMTIHSGPIGKAPQQRAAVSIQRMVWQEPKLVDEGGNSIPLRRALAQEGVDLAFGSDVRPTMELALYPGLTISGEIGGTYQIQFRTNLADLQWQLLKEVTLTQSPWLYLDTEATSTGERRFYRIIKP